ncbi:PDZ domain-containing protein [bacterium]|nr:PDZ domain-containing protein [bacterium]
MRRALARLAALSVALVPILGASGCGVLSRTSYWDDLKNKERTDSEEGEAHAVHFIGVRVSDEVAQFQVGVKLLHVFGSSPAARAGLEAGDELRSITPPRATGADKPAKVPVRSAEDVRKALAALSTAARETVEVVYVRGGKEHTTNVDLVHLPAYVEERRKRMFAEAAYGGSAFPFFYAHSTRRLTPSWIRTYFGIAVEDPVLVYEDFELFPIFGRISVMRRETADLYGGSRHTIVMWPFRITTANDDRTADLHDLIPARPEHTVDL